MKYDEICKLGDRVGELPAEQFWHVQRDVQYAALFKVLLDAYRQATSGKGAQRHASGEPFEEQPIMSISRQVGDGFCLGQAVKKIYESRRLEDRGAAVRELHGAIVYVAAAVLLREEKK